MVGIGPGQGRAGGRQAALGQHFHRAQPVSYTHLRAHETVLDLVCRLLLEKKTHTTEHDTAAINQGRQL